MLELGGKEHAPRALGTEPTSRQTGWAMARFLNLISGIPWLYQFHYAGPFHDDNGRVLVPFLGKS